MLAEHLRSAERNRRKRARATSYDVARWQGRLEHRQAFLGRLVDVGAELFAITAACVHARTLAEREPDRAQQAPKLADLFYGQTRRRVEGLFHELWANDCITNYAAAQRVLVGRYTWAESGILDPASAGAPACPGPASVLPWELPTVLLSPNTAALSVRENERIARLITDNLRRYLAGDELTQPRRPRPGPRYPGSTP